MVQEKQAEKSADLRCAPGPCGLEPDDCQEWDAARYAADLRSLRPEYGRVAESAILQALQTETDPGYRAKAYCQWRTADLGSIEPDRCPPRTLTGFLRNARRFNFGAQTVGGYNPLLDKREVI